MKSSFLDEGESHLQGLPAELEEWGVDCPEGTVPIIRKTSENVPDIKDYVPSFFVDDVKSLHNKSFPVFASYNKGHEYAVVQTIGKGTFRGGQAIHNVWTPHTETGEASISQIWIYAGPDETVNTVEAGWASDGYKSSGPGFVQTSKYYGPGSTISSTSTYNGKQFEINIQIRQDLSTQHWWLRLNDMDIGYWPGSIFNSLRGGADGVYWGGEIYNSEKNGQHTTTQMGSGHFPRDGYYTKSSFIRNLAYILNNGPMQPVPKAALVTYVSKPQCYDLVMGPSGLNFGTHFYFGGPGLSSQCPK
ncbi:uncharacterized protein LOC116199495 [Punica granatum]|uniref:Uncharacterized protein LOC116199495 n=1 Tax=Punica granatum TaxID=22663 RepID=A0A6P8CUE0_PUNGR|nr:uncharacterized protein LOC116199495 [Punica granatum]